MNRIFAIVSVVLWMLGCASTVEPDAVGLDDAAAVPSDAATVSDAPMPTEGAYVACDDSRGCPGNIPCILGVCTLPCSDPTARECPVPAPGWQVVCSERRCLYACNDRIECPGGTTCQRIGIYDVCAR